MIILWRVLNGLLPLGVLALFVTWVGINIHRVLLLSAGKKRKHLPRYILEQKLIDSGQFTFEEEYVPAPVTNSNRHASDKLYRQTWSKRGTTPPRAVIVFLHGLNSYGGRLAKDLKLLTDHGFVVVCIDQYGHGRSDGIHAYFDSIETWVEDVKYHIEQLKQKQGLGNLPLFLMGQSLGGSTSILYSTKYPQDIAGILVFCPLVEISAKSYPPPIIVKIASFLKKFYGEYALNSSTKGKGFKDYDVMEEYEKDHTIYHGPMRIATAFSLLHVVNVISKSIERLSKPLLVFHGTDDKMTDISGSRKLIQEAGSKSKELIEIPEGYHMLFEEKPAVVHKFLSQSIDWIEKVLLSDRKQDIDKNK